MRLGVPVDPGADEARDWLARELARPVYRAAEPSWFDRLVSGFWDWLSGLLGSGVGGSPTLLLVVVVLVVVGLLTASYFIFGPPRLNRRSTGTGAMFGTDDSRDAATIRRAAESAAAVADWPLAIEEMFRAIARGLSERAVLSTTPGTTAAGFAQRSREYFPDLGDALAASARAFDDVRYLGRAGSAADFDAVAAVERDLRTSTPSFDTERSAPVVTG